MRTCTAFLIACALFLSACGGSSSGDRQEYKLQGQVISVSADTKKAVIKHEDIPGFMKAMTMEYEAREGNEFAPLAPGDLITARLVVEPRGAYVEAVHKVGNAPIERATGSASAAAPGIPLLALGQPVPDVRLVDQDGKAVSLDTFRGSAIVVTFTYTGCPLPDMCPMLDRHFATMQKKLQDDKNELRVRLLSVTIDPEKDTAAVLKQYGQTLALDPKIWTFATGERAVIDEWAARFGVSVSRALNDASNITHNMRTVILDRQGNLVQSYSGNEWTPEQVLADVRVMVGVD